MSLCRAMLGLMSIAWLALPVGTAQASGVHSETVLVRGPEFLSVLLLPLDNLGSYKITTKDLTSEWLEGATPLGGLQFSVGTSGKTLASVEGLGTFQFFKSTSENMYLNIYGHAFAPDFAGLVGVTFEEDVAPVGLPGSLGLLASSLVGVLLLRRTSRARTGLVPSTP